MRRRIQVAGFVLTGILAGSALVAAVAAQQPGHRASPAGEPSSAAVPTNLLVRVLPACDNRPAETRVAVTEDGKTWTFYVAGRNKGYAGAAFAASVRGYCSVIHVLVGVNAAGTVQGIEILEHHETRGLGGPLENGFRSQFAGKEIAQTHWATRGNGGDIDAMTHATISSDAVTAAIKAGLGVYQKHRDEIRRGVESNAGAAGKTGGP